MSLKIHEAEMSSDNLISSYNLQELLCLNVFRKEYGVFGLDSFAKAVTEWAEYEVWAGAESETLLILASLGLESNPSRDEVELYFARYQKENGIADPDALNSALIWLRMRLEHIVAAANANEVEYRLAFFTQWYLDYPPRVFPKIISALSSLYWELYDEAIPVFHSRA